MRFHTEPNKPSSLFNHCLWLVTGFVCVALLKRHPKSILFWICFNFVNNTCIFVDCKTTTLHKINLLFMFNLACGVFIETLNRNNEPERDEIRESCFSQTY